MCVRAIEVLLYYGGTWGHLIRDNCSGLQRKLRSPSSGSRRTLSRQRFRSLSLLLQNAVNSHYISSKEPDVLFEITFVELKGDVLFET